MGSSCSILGCKVVSTRKRSALFSSPHFRLQPSVPRGSALATYSWFGSSEDAVSFPVVIISTDAGFPSLQLLCTEFISSQIDRFKNLHALPPDVTQKVFASLVAHKRLTRANFALFKKCLLNEITLCAYPALGNEWLELVRVHSVRLSVPLSRGPLRARTIRTARVLVSKTPLRSILECPYVRKCPGLSNASLNTDARCYADSHGASLDALRRSQRQRACSAAVPDGLDAA